MPTERQTIARPQQESGEPASRLTAALYVHIPFCEKRCNYCDFYTVAHRLAAVPRYVEALVREIRQYASQPFWGNQIYETIFFGGGTPSLLHPEQIAQILEAAQEHFRIDPAAEITLEANPGTTQAETIQGYFAAGVNRLSLGVQSFWPDELRQLDRIHSVADVRRTIHSARLAGFHNLSIDLIFALPGQRPSRWRHNLAAAVDLGVQHISAYNLSIEHGTPLYKLMEAGKVRPLSEWKERVLYNFTIDYLEARGFSHYEVSNYARPGFHSRHNTKYWDGSPYLGLGASAHSYDGARRFWNLDNYVHYCEKVEKGQLPVAGEELLTPEQREFEAIFLGLRQSRGVDLPAFARAFGTELTGKYSAQIASLLAHTPPLVRIANERLALTREGWLLADSVCGAFLPNT